MSLRKLSISQLAEVSELDRSTVKKILEEAKLESTIDGRAHRYPAREALAILLLDSGAEAPNVESPTKRLNRIILQIEEEKLEKLRFENGKSSGELVSVEDVAKAVEKEYAYVRSQFRSLPSKLAKPLSMVTDPNEIHSRLNEAVNECLSELTLDSVYEQSHLDFESAREAAISKPEAGAETRSDSNSSGMGGPEEISES